MAGWLTFEGQFSTDLTMFLPKQGNPVTALLMKQLKEGPASRTLLLAIEGGSASDRAQTSQRLAGTLRTDALFRRVVNGQGFISEAEQNWIFSRRYLLSAQVEPHHFSATRLQHALSIRLRDLQSALPLFPKEHVPADPTAEYAATLAAWQPMQQPASCHGVWCSSDGLRALLLMETNHPGLELDLQQHIIDTIKANFGSIPGTAGQHLILSGTGYFAVKSREVIRNESQLFSFIASGILMLFLLIVYRSPRLVMMSILPILTAILAGATLVNGVFGQIHGITLAFGITLLGLVIDYPLHVFSHIASNQSVHERLRPIWPTLFTGAATTAIAFAVFLFTSFTGLAQLGLFTISGLLTGAIVTRWIIPLWLETDKPYRHDPASSTWLDTGLKPNTPLRFTIFLITVLAITLAAMTQPLVWEDDLAALSPLPSKLKKVDESLRTQLGASDVRHVVLIAADRLQDVLEHSEAIAGQLDAVIDAKLLTGYDIVTRYLPSERMQRTRQAALPPTSELTQRLKTATHGLPFKQGLFTTFIKDMESARTAAPVDLEQVLASVVGGRVGSLLFKQESQWVAVVPLVGIKNPSLLRQKIESLNQEGVYFLDLKASADVLVRSFRDEAAVRIAWGGVLILLVLLISLRDLARVIRIVLSLALALMLELACLMWLGITLTLFHLIALLLVLGIGLDYALFFSRPDKEIAIRRRTLHAIGICAISTSTVFGILALSQIPVLRAIGLTTTLGVAAAFLMAMIFAQEPRNDN